MKKNNIDSRICIVGAGPAGISAAHFLVQAGYKNVTVLEKENRVGGKCCTKFFENEPYEMGAIEITPDYHFVNKFIKQFGLETTTIPNIDLIDFDNPDHPGQVDKFEYLFKSVDKTKLVEGAGRYLLALLFHYERVGVTGFHDIGKDIAQPFSKWLESSGMPAVRNMFLMPVTCYGYGYLENIPAAYVLKYMDYRNFMIGVYKGGIDKILGTNWDQNWPRRLSGGMQPLMEKIAECVTDIRLNATISKIDRKAGTVHYSDNSGEQTLAYDKLIVAIPQQTKNLGFLELDTRESDVFSRVAHNNYYTTLCQVDGLGFDGYLELVKDGVIQEPRDGYPFQFLQSWSKDDMCVFYSFSTQDLSVAQIEANLKTNLQKMNKTLVGIKETKKWDYFPHFKTEDLENNIYDRLYGLQGYQDTYYTGGLFNFELVENSIAYSHHMVSTYFGGS